MITDRAFLAGVDAYLRDSAGTTNLAGTHPKTGHSPMLADGQGLDVRGIWMSISAPDLREFFIRGGTPLFRVRVQKELFPGLFADPYASRVHAIAGFDDFKRGTGESIRVLEVGGVPTLIATDEICSWTSMIYSLPQTVSFAQFSWAMATSRQIAPGTLQYKIELRCWVNSPQNGTSPDATVAISGDGVNPTVHSSLSSSGPIKCQAFQVTFSAMAAQDTEFTERHAGRPDVESLGRPLLQAFRLIEETPPLYEFYSVPEINSRCREFTFFPQTEGESPSRAMFFLELPAMLLRNEQITLEVQTDKLELLEAWLDAEMITRMPPGKRG